MKRLVVITSILRVCQTLLLGLSVALIARGLGTELRGIYGLAIWMPMTLCIVGQFGQVAVNSTFPGLYSRHRSEILCNNFILIFISSLLCLAFYFFFYYYCPWPIGKFSELPNIVILSAALWIPLFLAESLLREFARGCEFILQTALVTTLSNALQLLAVIAFVFIFPGHVFGALASLSISSFLAVIGYLFLVRRYISFFQFSLPLFLKSCRAGATFMVGTTALFLTLQMPFFFLSFYEISDSQLGLYSFAILLAAQAQCVPAVIAQVFLPKLSNSLACMSQQTSHIFRFSLIASAFIGLFMAIAAYPCIYIIAGPEYTACVPCFLILVPGITLFGPIRILGMYLWAHQKQGITTRNNVISLLVVIPASLFLIPRWSIFGASLAITIGYFNLTVLTTVSYLLASNSSWRSLVATHEDCHKLLKIFRDSIHSALSFAYAILSRIGRKAAIPFLNNLQ